MHNSSLIIKTAAANFLMYAYSNPRVNASSNDAQFFPNNGNAVAAAKKVIWPQLQWNNVASTKSLLQKWAAACLLVLMACTVFAQQVGIGTNTPHPSTALDVVSNTKGLAIPALTTLQRTAIASPKAGLFVFDTDRQTLCMFNGSHWVYFQSSVEPNTTLPVEQMASDGQVGDRFGEAVAIEGNYAVVGASLANIAGNNDQGCAYVFFYNGSSWIEQAKLTAADGAADDHFGKSVSISGNYIVVGAPDDNIAANSNQGSAYVFLRSGSSWSQQAKLTAADGAGLDYFGAAVSICGNYIVVGAYGDDVGANAGEGSAYFFVRSGISWTQQDQVVAPFGAAGDSFGYAVSLSGDVAVIGAPNDVVNGVNLSGSAHFFRRVGTNWSHQQQENLTGQTSPLFGTSVSINNNVAIVGASGNAGSNLFGFSKMYYYNGSTWVLSAFFPMGGGFPTPASSHFGKSVGIYGNHAYVGADFFSVLPDNISCGKAYLFESPNGIDWYFLRDVLDPLAGYAHQFGYAVATAESFCIAGSAFANGEKGKVLFLRIQ